MPVRLEPDRVDGAVHLRLTDQRLQRLPQVAGLVAHLGQVQGLYTRAEFLDVGQTVGVDIADDDDGGAEEEGGGGRADTDWSGPGDVHGTADGHLGLYGGVEARGKDITEHSKVEDVLLGFFLRQLQRLEVCIRDEHVLRLPAFPTSHIRKTERATRLFVIGTKADGGFACFAVVAGAARDIEGYGDPVAHFEVAHGGAQLHHLTRHLVTEGATRGYDVRPRYI